MRIIKLINYLLAIIALPAFLVEAQEVRVCRSPYALLSKNFNYKEYSKQTSGIGEYTTVFLWNTFGNEFDHLSKEMAKPEVTGVEIALFNTTCVRRDDCGKYETLYGYTIKSLSQAIRSDNSKLKGKLRAEAARAADVILPRLRPNQKCYLNPYLEHNMSRGDFQTSVDWFKDIFQGRCEIVWNPAGGSPGTPQAPGLVSEGHGSSPSFGNFRCIANPDGTEIVDAEYPHYLNRYGTKCEFACTWGSNDNCRSTTDKVFVDPRKRTCKEVKDFKRARNAIIAARKIKPVPPWDSDDEKSTKGCKTFLDISDGYKKGFLWKQSTPECCGRGAVTFLPEKYNKSKFKLSEIFVMKEDKKIATAYERGVYTEDKSNRQFWRFRKKAYDFPYNVTVHFGTVCAKIADPTQRVD